MRISSNIGAIGKHILLLIFLIGLLGCSPEDTKTNANMGSEAKSAISWGGPKNIAMLPILAQQKGFFEKHKLKSNFSYLQTGKITLDAVVRGEIDFGVIVEATIAFAAFQPNLGIKIIAINQVKMDDSIVARKDSHIASALDMEGKRLGVTRGTNSQMYAYKFMEVNNINPANVTIVNLSPPAIVAALNNGEIDAGSVWQPYRYNLNKQLGENALNFTNDDIYRGYAIVAVNEKFLQDNPDTVNNFLLALKDAEHYIKSHKDESINLIAKEIDIEESLLSALWHEYHVELTMTPKLTAAMEDEGHWIIKNIEAFNDKQLPEYKELVDSTTLSSLFQ